MTVRQKAVKKRVAIVTNNLNCERNTQYYSTIEKYFTANGWEICDDFNVNKVIISGCGFHDAMYKKIRRTVEYLRTIHFLEKNIIIVGCTPRTHE
ncbi:MAG: hypothetical protein GY757_56955, partial [bacterium]|nr:hypothetical protein [bacterium]